ncbi:MAG: hypothetical protein H3C53_05345 [Trueperaceae bacterium]|nr:hypothetical protein [Trueperaceae bacterium]
MNEQAGFLSSRFRVGAIFVTVLIALASMAGARAQSGAGPVVWLNLTDSHNGVVRDRAELHEVLGDLGVLPEGPEPRVVSVHSLDSMFPHVAVMTRSAQEIITRAVREAGGEEPVFVAAPWGWPQQRAVRGSIYPTTPEELEAHGYGWLLAPDGFRVAWDHDSKVAELAANRGFMAGSEYLQGVHMYLCVDGESVRGWARAWAYRGHREPTDASLGRFARDCLQDGLHMPDEYVVPEDVRTALGLDGWFAVLLPNAIDQHVPIGVAVDSAREMLAFASVPIPLHPVVVETVTADLSEFVPREEHAAMLAELGVSVDPAFQASFPEWVRDFATHSRTILVVFDDAGRAVGHFAPGYSNGFGEETLVGALMRWGLF